MTNNAERIGQTLKFLYCAQTLSNEARVQDFPILADTFALAVRNAELYLAGLEGRRVETPGE